MKLGLTQRIFYHKNRVYDSIEHGWYHYLKNHSLIFVPNDLNQDFHAVADNIDALIITGGDDSAVRRVTELRLSSVMMKLHKPILGICHGAFLLTDVLGGRVTPCHGHMDVEHSVEYLSGKKLVNSYHTQTISLLHSSGQGLAWDADGNCEAWIDGNISGVVWHPERMTDPWIPTEISNRFQIN